MRPHQTANRRTVLKELGLGALSTAWPVLRGMDRSAASTQGQSVISLNSPSDVEIEYTFTVSGTLKKSEHVPPPLSLDAATIDPDDQIDGSTAHGSTQGGVDSYTYSGEITDFGTTNCAAANVWIDDSPVDACKFRQAESTDTGNHNGSTNILSINSPSDTQVSYEVSVTGNLEKSRHVPARLSIDAATRDPIDIIDGTVVNGSTQGGVDSYRYTGEIDAFTATNCGAANVWVNDNEVDACQLTGGDSQGSDCMLDAFRNVSTTPASVFEQRREKFRELADRARNLQIASDLLSLNIEGYQALLELSYGDWKGTVGEFLDLAVEVTDEIAQSNSGEFYDTVHDYTESAHSSYTVAFADDSTTNQYIELLSTARDDQKEPTLDSMLAALRLGAQAARGNLRREAMNIAVELSMIPTNDALSALDINARQMFILKSTTESQRPVLDVLARIARRRDQGIVEESEMYSYFILLQQHWLTATRFGRHAHQLEELGQEQTILYDLKDIVVDTLGMRNSLQSTQKTAEMGARNYQLNVEKLINLRQQLEECP